MSAKHSAKGGKVGTYFKGVKAETKKVIWPSKQELANYTGVVVLISVIVGLVIWVLDMGIHRLLSIIV